MTQKYDDAAGAGYRNKVPADGVVVVYEEATGEVQFRGTYVTPRLKGVDTSGVRCLYLVNSGAGLDMVPADDPALTSLAKKFRVNVTSLAHPDVRVRLHLSRCSPSRSLDFNALNSDLYCYGIDKLQLFMKRV